VAEFMGERAALPHRVPRARDPDEDGPACRVAYCHAVLVGTRVEHRDVDVGRLLDDRRQVAERLLPEMVLTAEPRGQLAALCLC
jgi:hypothetical protein